MAKKKQTRRQTPAQAKPPRRSPPRRPAPRRAKPGRRGPKPGTLYKSIDEHMAEGTWRRDRHGAQTSQLLAYPRKPAARLGSARSQSRWCRNEADCRAVRAGYRFCEALAEHAAAFFPAHLCHSIGEWYGKPFELTPFQRAEIICPLFGWLAPDGTRRFRYTYIELPKKNYKSTTASGIGLYMLVADEEPGAQIFSLAADKDQARIVHNEAINMVEASPALAAILKINRTTGAILYPAMKAYYRALSGSPRGKHGINIHCGIADELHEWYGDELWNALKYGYRARRQPLQFVITNAGEDVQSVCYRQRQKAEGVLAGRIEDHRFFALIRSATDKEAEAEIESVRGGATELPVARRCNPAFGHVLKPETLLSDIKDAITNPAELRNLLRLTYGVWCTGKSPYLGADAWSRCRDDGAAAWPAELAGRPCGAAVDASQRDDLSALALVFPGDEENPEERTYRLLVHHWIAEEAARNRQHLIDFATWARNGWLTIVPGPVIDMAWVRARIQEAAQQYRIARLQYDPMYFETTAEQLRTEDAIEAVKFPQTIVHFAGPTRQLRLLVNSGRLRHEGNPLLDWQIGHCETRTDMNANERPVKPKPWDVRKIDGVVAAIMALDAALATEGEGSAYEDHGVLYADEV